ncbi:MAG: two-component system sensor histidine kinase/response regulator [Paraglaciecola sp.]|jgi:two-component system sensor histidine kinase/response regulator
MMRVSHFIRTKLRQHHRLVLLTLFIFASGSAALNHVLISQFSSAANMTRLSSQQAMLSQRITVYQDRLATGEYAQSPTPLIDQLIKLTKEFELNHWTIIGALPTKTEAHTLSKAQQQHYFFSEPSLHQQSIDFITLSRDLVKKITAGQVLPSALPLASLNALFAGLNQAVFQFELEASKQTNVLINIQWQLWMVVILLLFFNSVFIFKPMEKLVLRVLRKYRTAPRRSNETAFDTEIKSQFLMNTAHELRTLVSGLYGMITLAEHESEQGKQAKQLQKAQSSSRDLLSLIDNILDMSWIELDQHNLENIDFELIPLLDNCLSPANEICEKNALEFSYEATSTLPTRVKGDPARLSRIIHYLVSNGIKLTPYGSIKTSASVSVKNQGYLFNFAVHDTGLGMKKSDLSRILDKCPQLNNDGSQIDIGTGLGLTIAKKLVREMGGSIEVVSTLGKGSTVTISLPLGKSDFQAQLPSLQSTMLPTTRFAVVDDLQTSRDNISMILQTNGYQADTFDSGSHILRSSNDVKKYTAVIVNIHMPGLSGYELAEILHAQHGDACPALVFVSASADSLHKAKFAFVDQWPIFTKPINKDRFIEYMHLLASGSGQSDSPKHALNILVVEDEPINAEVLLSMLNKMGHYTLHAANGDQAVTLATTEDIDLILMDINLPDFSGIEASHKILKEHKIKVPIIAITANVYLHDKLSIKQAGMRYHLTKPVQFNELKDVVATLSH